jgi:hypothetical protein
MKNLIFLILLGAAFVVARTNAHSFSFTTGAPDGAMATASPPDSPAKIETENNPAPEFNEAFSPVGTVPDFGSTALLLGSTAGLLFYLRRRIRA